MHCINWYKDDEAWLSWILGVGTKTLFLSPQTLLAREAVGIRSLVALTALWTHSVVREDI